MSETAPEPTVERPPIEAVVSLDQAEVNEIYATFDLTPSEGVEQKLRRASVQAKLVDAVRFANQLAQIAQEPSPPAAEDDPAPQDEVVPPLDSLGP